MVEYGGRDGDTCVVKGVGLAKMRIGNEERLTVGPKKSALGIKAQG